MPHIEPEQLRVVRGGLDHEELAALVVVINAALAHAQQQRDEHDRISEWNAAHRFIRRTLPHGQHAWRRSALPA